MIIMHEFNVINYGQQFLIDNSILDKKIDNLKNNEINYILYKK